MQIWCPSTCLVTITREFRIESDFDGGIAAEVFAAVHPKSNNKLQKDIQKVLDVNVKHKYVFFMCPNIKKGYYPNITKNEVIVWSLGYE